MVRTRVSVSISDKTSIFHPKTCVTFRGKAKKTLSHNNIKCGKLFVSYSKMNCIFISSLFYTTTGKYCTLILLGVMTFNVSDSACSPI